MFSIPALALLDLLRDATPPASARRIRYNVASPEGKDMLKTYAAGVKAMKALPPQDPKSWIFQWYVHATPQPKAQMLNAVYPRGAGATFGVASATWFTCQAHQGEQEDYFLPWHRLYVLQFEQVIRSLTKRDDFTLPYWDYTSPGSYAIPEEFQAKHSADPLYSSLFVRNRNKDGGQFQSANVNAGEPLNKHFPGVRNFLVLPNLKEANYTTFNGQLDQQLHGAIHVYVGDTSNMGNVPTAAGDPVFWLHHCNIDRIWAAWHASGGKNPAATNGKAWADTEFVFPGPDGQPTRMTVASIADSFALPYEYDKLPGVELPALVASENSDMDVLMRSAAPGAVLSKSATSAESVAVPLGAGPAKVQLAPTDPANSLRAMIPDTLVSGGGKLVLVLKDVQAKLDPNTTYQVYLNLPENASREVEDQHYVGLVNFFGLAPAPGQETAKGKDFEFDITKLAQTLRADSKLGDDASVTLVPIGQPVDSSSPTVRGGIELMKR
jgi:tyrosinase